MNKVCFYLQRSLRREAPLMKMSVSQAALLDGLSDKSVALIGNARALQDTTYGADIDAHDVVVRINRAPMPSRESHGARTDWLALATALTAVDRARLDVGRFLWMSHKRKRLDWATATSKDFYLHPLGDYAQMKTMLSAQPTTGVMMIDLLLRSKLNALSLYGFDFFASLSLSGKRTAESVPHDFMSEGDYVRNLVQTTPKITLHPME
jgi:hypothetical protein